MAKYTPRTSAPSTSNKNYIHTSAGGYNHCIHIGGGSCLPNCVGYAWGRWRELLGKTPKLSLNNAENWYPYTADGYKRGKTPKLGAVICWRKGMAGVASDGAGHVAIVEEIKANGDIVTSESCYGGERFRTRTYTKASGYYLGSSFTFQGFIYPPVTFEVDEPKKATSSASSSSSKVETYKVKKGDTLSAIASKYGTTYQKLAEYNGIADPNKISVGQVLKIPGASPSYKVHTVKSGESLSSIASQYGTTYQALAKYNGIENPNLIYKGQKIKIPV